MRIESHNITSFYSLYHKKDKPNPISRLRLFFAGAKGLDRMRRLRLAYFPLGARNSYEFQCPPHGFKLFFSLNKKRTRRKCDGCIFHGDGGIRTLDLSDANRTLSQLSYAPSICRIPRNAVPDFLIPSARLGGCPQCRFCLPLPGEQVAPGISLGPGIIGIHDRTPLFKV